MNKKRLNQFLIPLLYHFVCIGVWAETLPDHTQEWQTVYEEKFDQVGNDELPDDFLYWMENLRLHRKMAESAWLCLVLLWASMDSFWTTTRS